MEIRNFKHPFVYFWIILIILFGLVLFPGNQEEDVSFLANVAGVFNQDDQVFLSPDEKVLLESPDFLLVQGNSIRAASPVNVISPRVLGALFGEGETVRQAIIEYLVRSGDNLWSIANKFNISVDTIIWANNLRSTIINPGQRLIILPVSGVRHVVRERDTLGAVVEKYEGAEIEKIIDFNNLPNEGDIFVGQSLIVPGGTKPGTISATIATNVDITTLTPNQVRAKFSTNNYWGQSHSFPFGQCTWWVAQKRPIPAWGNANTWLPNARAAGFQTCRGRFCIPRVGAVIVVKGNIRYGHVGYVENIRGNKITFSEMNTIGWGRINTRTVRIGDSSIIGYIF